MRIGSGRVLGMMFAVGFAHPALAAEDAGTTVKTAADSAKLGAEFRAELNYDNHGLEKREGVDPEATTSLDIDAAKVKLNGKLNKDTEYAFRFNLLRPVTGPLEYGYGTHWFGDAFGFSIGRMKTMQGGWDWQDESFKTHVVGPYADNLTFKKYEDMIALHLKAAGKVNVQILNDVVADATHTTRWNEKAHPTFVVGWLGQFGDIYPLVDVGTYDNQKSRWIDVGVKTTLAGVEANVDVKMDSMAAKGADKDGKAKEFTDTATSFTVRAGYNIKDTAKPWVYYSKYDRKEYEDKDLGLEDAKANVTTYDKATDKETLNFADNGTAWGVGADLFVLGKGWTPYLAVVGKSGKFADPVDTTKDQETRSGMQVRLGAYGEF